MDLSQIQKQQLAPMIQQAGSLGAFFDAVKDVYVQERQAAALTALSGAISVTVTDWAALTAHFAQASNVTMYAVRDAIDQAIAAKDTSKLGPLFLVEHAALSKHLGK
jgi:hypothetical protein